ncbi:MAG: ParB/RepB/Spo0J family partition protein [Chloroflexi bacterium]|nr:ParB/RepB/Spo0J family partition protein [Chloroflexota bacterium]
MSGKDLRSAFTKNRITTNSEAGVLGVVGISEILREELERSAEAIRVQDIPIENLGDNPFQYLARTSADPSLKQEVIEELAASIRQNGFYGALLARLTLRSNSQVPTYELAYGHRRRMAAQLAGLKTLPVKVMELTDSKMARIMASENFSREDLTPIGEANVVGMLYTLQNLSADKIAEVVGKTRRWVQIRVELYEAAQDIKDMTERKPDTLTYVPILKQVKDPDQRKELIEAILDDQLTREQLRNKVENLKQATNQTKIVKSITISTQGADSDDFHNDNADLEGEAYLIEKEVKASPQPPEVNHTTGKSIIETKVALPELEAKSTKGSSYQNVLKQLETTIIKLEKLAKVETLIMNETERNHFEKLLERAKELLEK